LILFLTWNKLHSCICVTKMTSHNYYKLNEGKGYLLELYRLKTGIESNVCHLQAYVFYLLSHISEHASHPIWFRRHQGAFLMGFSLKPPTPLQLKYGPKIHSIPHAIGQRRRLVLPVPDTASRTSEDECNGTSTK
jgi:hypothetical protein